MTSPYAILSSQVEVRGVIPAGKGNFSKYPKICLKLDLDPVYEVCQAHKILRPKIHDGCIWASCAVSGLPVHHNGVITFLNADPMATLSGRALLRLHNIVGRNPDGIVLNIGVCRIARLDLTAIEDFDSFERRYSAAFGDYQKPLAEVELNRVDY